MKSKSTTIIDVARYANVSYQTVSRVLNNSANVSVKTRQKVERAIAELKYVPNRVAQQLVGKESKTVGLVTISLALHAPSQIAAAVKKYAKEHGYQVLISMLDDVDINCIQTAINDLKAQQVTKLIINAPLETAFAETLVAENRDILCLFLDVEPCSPVFNVTFNPDEGARASVKYLYDLGHRQFCLISGPENSVSARLRINSWSTALASLQLTPLAIHYGNWDARSGYLATLQILRDAPQTTALLLANDQMALGALSALHQQKRKIPQDISVVGYDDTYESAFFEPTLTTVAIDFDLQSKIAVQQILQSDDAQAVLRSSTILPSRLVVRNSVGPLHSEQTDLINIAGQLRMLSDELMRKT
ncbi:TPA: LacI family DNA-binding transcriptional regulator [Escherichia coli]|uniref:LacI family DNA-binding transcriptional regulator n=1 Tax=Escherichia albertii TaxID=208962 RepID=UPI0007437C2E|nr:LacI family DNA-binding transcriptional regulator [Escherichia albertii]HCQ4576655.1 LacI family DNA-binding transcriptional regulator [Escherichia albertii]